MENYNKYRLTKNTLNHWSISTTKTSQLLNEYSGVRTVLDHKYKMMHESLIDSIDFNKHLNLYVFGLRNTKLIEAILMRKSAYTSLTVIEICEDDVIELTGTKELGRLFNDVNTDIIIGDKEQILKKIPKNVYNLIRIYNIYNTDFIINPYVNSLHFEEMMEIKSYVLENMDFYVSAFGNSVEDMLVGSDNLMNNWKFSVQGKSVKRFKDSFKDTPAVIVGAGPSLNKNIELLNDAKKKALIFAVDAAIDDLNKHDIIPDAISSVERTDEPVRFYNNFNTSEETVFAGPNIIPGQIMEKFDSWILTGRKSDAIFRSIIDNYGDENIEIGSNVAHVSYAVARYLGCNPIILCGLDLAYTGGKTHSDEVTKFLDEDAELKSYYDKFVRKVKGINGEMLDTYEYFLYAKTWFEQIFASDYGTKIYNATEGGAYISGAEHLAMEEVLRIISDKPNIEKRLRQVYQETSNDENRRAEITKKTLDFMISLEDDLDSILELVNEAHDALRSESKHSKVKDIEGYRFKLDEKLLNYHTVRFLYQPIYMSYNRDLHSFPIKLEHDDEMMLLERSIHYYDTLIRVSKKIRETFKIYQTILEENLYDE